MHPCLDYQGHTVLVHSEPQVLYRAYASHLADRRHVSEISAKTWGEKRAATWLHGPLIQAAKQRPCGRTMSLLWFSIVSNEPEKSSGLLASINACLQMSVTQ